MALNEAERSAIRHYMGFPQVVQAVLISFGVPDKTQLNFVLETNMGKVLPEAEPRVRRSLQELECIEEQMSSFRPSLELKAVTGSVQFRTGEAMMDLEETYKDWVGTLADLLGSPVNPFSNRLNRMGYGLTGVIEPT